MPPPQVGPWNLQEPPSAAGSSALGGARPLSRDPQRAVLRSQRFALSAHPMPTLCPAPTLSVPTARRSPRCLLPGSQRPTARPPIRSSASRATYRAERPQPLELWRLAGLRAAPAAAESEIASFPRPRRQRLELVPAASARAARARLVRSEEKPTDRSKVGGWRDRGTCQGRGLYAPPRPLSSPLHHALPRVTPFPPALLSSASHAHACPAPSPRHAPLLSRPGRGFPSAERCEAPESSGRSGCRGGAGRRAGELRSPRPLAEAP